MSKLIGWALAIAFSVVLAGASGAAHVASAEPSHGTAAPDPERLALARDLVEAAWPPVSLEAAAASEPVAQGLILMVEGYSVTDFKIDLQQFAQSYRVGRERTLARSRDALVQHYARTLSADVLRAGIAFYRSDAGRAALHEQWDCATRVVHEAQASEAEHGECPVSAAQKAFNDTPPGQALQAATKDTTDLTWATAREDIWSSMVEEIEGDYCSHRRCEDLQRNFFRMLTLIGARHHAHGEHAMTGQTAQDLFADPKLVNLARAACEGRSDAVADLVRNGANPNGVGLEGIEAAGRAVQVTPLIWAIDCDNPTGMEALIAAGADVNRSGKYGTTPVTDAAAREDPALLAVLLKHGGDPNAHDDHYTALEIALQSGVGVVEVQHKPAARVWANWNALLAASADVNQVDGESQTVAVKAAIMNQFDRVLELLDRGYSHELDELGRWVEYSERMGLTAPEEVAPRDKVKARLVAAGVVFPVPRKRVAFSYLALDGTLKQVFDDTAKVLGSVTPAPGQRPPLKLWWFKVEKVFAEEADDTPEGQPSMHEITVERVKTVYGLTDAEIQSIQDNPDAWHWRNFNKP